MSCLSTLDLFQHPLENERTDSQGMDSDGNGYVSCDYTIVSDPNRTYSLECAAWGWDGFMNQGCKTRLPK